MWLSHNIVLDDRAFADASERMLKLKKDTEDLKTRMSRMYADLKSAMQTPAGDAVELVSEKVVIKPIEDMLLVIEHISSTLTEISGTRYYKDVFVQFEELNASVKFDQ